MPSMVDPWKWMFARWYIHSDRKYGKKDVPDFTAACATSFVILVNILTVLSVGAACFGVAIYDIPDGEYYVGGGSLAILAVVYWRYVIKGTAKPVIKRLRKQSLAATRRGEWMMHAYFFGSVVVGWIVAQ